MRSTAATVESNAVKDVTGCRAEVMQIVHVLHNLCARRIGATLKHGLYPGGIVSRVSDWELDRFQFPYDDTSRTELKET